MEARVQHSIQSPAAWYETFPAVRASGDITGPFPALIKHFSAIPGDLDQPPLNAHVVALHLGGPKRVRRTQGKRKWVHDVELGALTFMPAYQANRWDTEGPIDFAHVTMSAGTLAQIVAEEFDRDPAACTLHDTVGVVDPLLEQLFYALLGRLERRARSGLHTDSLLIVFAATLLERHSTLSSQQTAAARSVAQQRGGLAGWQLRRVVDYMHTHLKGDVALRALAELTGLSRAHFFRAFRRSTGQSPGHLLADLRTRHAALLLQTTDLPIDEVATALGFSTTKSFNTAFTKRMGIAPRLFRTRCD